MITLRKGLDLADVAPIGQHACTQALG